jgi:hypothetical protein
VFYVSASNIGTNDVSRKYGRDILDAFERLGGTGAELVYRGTHMQLRGTLYGTSIRYTLSASPSDYRAMQNAISEIKSIARRGPIIRSPRP